MRVRTVDHPNGMVLSRSESWYGTIGRGPSESTADVLESQDRWRNDRQSSWSIVAAEEPQRALLQVFVDLGRASHSHEKGLDHAGLRE